MATTAAVSLPSLPEATTTIKQIAAQTSPERLEYDINECSSYSASYFPANIQTDSPHEQSSRWSSGSNNQAQFITLKLSSLALVSMWINIYILRNDYLWKVS
jgi:hypothetical protein